MSKISAHKDKEKIEKIILEHKFRGLGSSEIQNTLLNKLAFKVSRPTIDEYYSKHLNGALLSGLIENSRKQAILSVSNGESATDGTKPAYNDEEAQKVYNFVGEWQNADNWSAKPEIHQTFEALREVYATGIGLLLGNMEAHKEGKERLKLEYVKYIKELKPLMRGNY